MNSRSGSVQNIYQSNKKRAETRSRSRDKNTNPHQNDKGEFILTKNDKPPKPN